MRARRPGGIGSGRAGLAYSWNAQQRRVALLLLVATPHRSTRAVSARPAIARASYLVDATDRQGSTRKPACGLGVAHRLFMPLGGSSGPGRVYGVCHIRQLDEGKANSPSPKVGPTDV